MTVYGGQKIYADDFNALEALLNWAPVVAFDATGGSTTSTSYTGTLTGVVTPLSLTFVAPKTTMIIVTGGQLEQNINNPAEQYMSPVVTGPYSFYWGPNDNYGLKSTWVNNAIHTRAEWSYPCTGLVVGQTYTVTAQFKVTAYTATFYDRKLLVHM